MPPLPEPFLKSHVRILPPGQRIFAAGDPGGSVFYIVEGRVRIEGEVEGEGRTLAIIEQGEFFGEMSFFDGLARSATAVTVTRCRILELDNAGFEEALQADPSMAIPLLKSISGRLRQSNRQLRTLMTRDKLLRVIDYLLVTVVKEADIGEEGLFLATGGDPADYLARQCNIPRDSLEGILGILRDRGVIEVEPEGIHLKAFTPLKRLKTYLELRSEFAELG